MGKIKRKNEVIPMYKDSSKSFDDRIDNLISRMTIEEKCLQLNHESKAIERLGIPAYNWWNECLHGLARAGRATVFPQAIGLAATFDPELLHKIATAISDEARAKYHAAQRLGISDIYRGLTFWTPNINIFRDPRWGRGQETYGEDPYLTSRMGVAFVKGLQGNHKKYLKVAACAKHFAVHSGPEKDRHSFNAESSLKDMKETYLPAFKALVEAGVEAVMGAYNRTNSEPCCASDHLLDEILRKEWNFKGHVVTDCWAVQDFHGGHQCTNTPAESAAMALKKGSDLNCGDEYAFLLHAWKKKLITENDIDIALKRILRTRFKLGLLDVAKENPYSHITEKNVDFDKHAKLAREAAAKSIVLLKNKNNILPLKKDLKSLFIIGPNAASVEILLGNYFGINNKLVTIVEGIAGKADYGSSIQYRQGFLIDRENDIEYNWAASEAAKYDITVAAIGINALIEGEEGDAIASKSQGDRIDINLPQCQIDFMKKLKENGKPLIAVVSGGSPLALQEIHEIADAVLFVWYPGQEGGNAIADVLFGDVSPSGKLPVTFPRSVEQLPPFEDYSMKNRTYRYMQEEPLYPFGFGLSYSKFDYGEIKLNKSIFKKNEYITAVIEVKNIGKTASDEVIQLYLSYPKNIDAPFYALKSFERIHLKPKEKKKISFTVSPQMLTCFDKEGKEYIPEGQFRMYFGGCSPGKRATELGAALISKTTFRIKK